MCYIFVGSRKFLWGILKNLHKLAFVLHSSVDYASCGRISVGKFCSSFDNIPFRSYSTLDAIAFISEKNNHRDVYVGF